MENSEVWRTVLVPESKEDYYFYMVSNFGNVKVLHRPILQHHNSVRIKKERILKKQLSKKAGYEVVRLTPLSGTVKRKCYMVSRLVVWAFPEICGKWFPGAEVNHKNENKLDNRAVNLEVCDRLYNIRYGTGLQRRGLKRMKKVIAIKDGVENEYRSIKEAAKELNISVTSISLCINKKINKVKGYNFKNE